ncbi:1-deoxy-D-xylulose-5-phosphate reductoisomerase [Roseovarius sp. SCSIO 43702]|uniref:1-deoxy-D-xylulose-5-phosphate reductoisomerase n=1 Tax=Roseovarius sp. SCSIO 43702 TaxID=2823043 RepID=UPI001C73DE02|nr:1-deoxy-D-xylulose-5-phosphate reductoisomerase [Roseovarius sp. SCSIO 43702]QYX58403.1 1-deoxy-D-xylulose-5-phosphate reductoisomerase [Roseovarius sp. SCSIO 43702]
MKRISILGATGSIGQSTIDLVARAPESYAVEALTGGRNVARLAEDARRLGARIAVTAHDDLLGDLRAALEGSGVEAAAGTTALIEAAARPADWVMSAIVGAAGLAPGLAAVETGTTLALANKETLVTAGPLLMARAQASGATVLPVDSEHSAIFQSLRGEDMATVERIILTASGGAFRDRPLEELHEVTVAEASTHPNWAMGQRITIDSASMFNKALEVIETREFFGVEPERIEVVIHPESIVHALVGHRDGGVMAHMGAPDMRHAIGYALNWPGRATLPVERLDLVRLGQLTFREADPARYKALALARRVMAEGGLAGAVFNAAKERALDHFIAGRIGFLRMADLVERAMDEDAAGADGAGAEITLETVTHADQVTRQAVDRMIGARAE